MVSNLIVIPSKAIHQLLHTYAVLIKQQQLCKQFLQSDGDLPHLPMQQ